MAVTRKKLTVGLSAAVAAAAIGTGLAFPAGAAPAEATVVGAGSASAVEGSYIVTMKESAVSVSAGEGEAGEDVITEHGGTVEDTFDAALNGYAAASLTEREARRLAADPAVEKVYVNQRHTVSAEQTDPPNWGLDRIDQQALPLDQSYTYPDDGGQGVTAYVIDTGVMVEHEDFGGRAGNGFDAVENDDVAQDGNGHGTHVASTIAGTEHGVAKNAEVVGVRVLDDNGSGTTAQVVAGIEWVAENASGPSVANMSLGGPQDPALDEAVSGAVAAGVTFVVAAGNEAQDANNVSPARVPEAITVGATDDADGQAGFSNYGSALDLYAPGVDITAAWNDGATKTISGTSMASPHAAGVAALYLAGNGSASPADVSAALTDAAARDVVGNPGSGSPNLLLNLVK
ncbi:hypothetical protein GCM10023347_10570 [Streptomyces chumphonensis]|uniref:S8 family peptidase n=1 Tax=Streptomyces chumphonensis TaxID=1214925 RepID=A0A927F118_9ACTN|nr:S8 family peptidase [Streptomyces chumphonensis]MBD3933468.1 S8 family peptidase [Streptomyces chumphonensis]